MTRRPLRVLNGPALTRPPAFATDGDVLPGFNSRSCCHGQESTQMSRQHNHHAPPSMAQMQDQVIDGQCTAGDDNPPDRQRNPDAGESARDAGRDQSGELLPPRADVPWLTDRSATIGP